MISSIHQAASNIQTILRGWGNGGHSAGAASGDAVVRPVRGVDEGSTESGVGAGESPPREAREPEDRDARPIQEDPTDQAIDTIGRKTAVRSNLAVIRSADRMLGTLLDVMG